MHRAGRIVNRLILLLGIAMIVYYALAAVYTVCRFFYIKKKEGVNLFKKMSTTYQPWEEREEALKAGK